MKWLDPFLGVEYFVGVLGPLTIKKSKEDNVKKTTKLGFKKVTLRNLDDPTLTAMAGGLTGTCLETVCLACATITVAEKICSTCLKVGTNCK